MHFHTQHEVKEAARKIQKRMADLGHDVPLQIVLEGVSHAAFAATWNIVVGKLPKGKAAGAEQHEDVKDVPEETVSEGERFFNLLRDLISETLSDLGFEVRMIEEMKGRFLWHNLAQQHDSPIVELTYAGGAEGRIDIDMHARPISAPMPYSKEDHPTYTMAAFARGNGQFMLDDLRHRVRECFSGARPAGGRARPPYGQKIPESEMRAFLGETSAPPPSELRRLLGEALTRGFRLLTLTEDGSPARKPIQGRGSDNLNYPMDIGDHEAAFAELGISLPVDDAEGAGWVVLDGRRIEYQAAPLHRHDSQKKPGWAVVFHLHRPSPHPASKYRPDVIL